MTEPTIICPNCNTEIKCCASLAVGTGIPSITLENGSLEQVVIDKSLQLHEQTEGMDRTGYGASRSELVATAYRAKRT